MTSSYICSNSQQYTVWLKIILFYLMPKIIRISCPMKIFYTVNISKLNYWLVICIAKNLIWTTLKMIFSIFRFFCTLSNIAQTIHQWKYYLFSFQMMHTSQLHKIDPHDWFCAPGSHMLKLQCLTVCKVLLYTVRCVSGSVCRSCVTGSGD